MRTNTPIGRSGAVVDVGDFGADGLSVGGWFRGNSKGFLGAARWVVPAQAVAGSR